MGLTALASEKGPRFAARAVRKCAPLFVEGVAELDAVLSSGRRNPHGATLVLTCGRGRLGVVPAAAHEPDVEDEDDYEDDDY